MNETVFSPGVVERHAELLREARPQNGDRMHPEMMIAVGSYVQSNFGHAGYDVGLLGSNGTIAAFVMRSTDGSEVQLLADRYGNVYRVSDAG